MDWLLYYAMASVVIGFLWGMYAALAHPGVPGFGRLIILGFNFVLVAVFWPLALAAVLFGLRK